MEQTKPSQSLPDNAYRELKPGEEYVPMMPADAKPKEVTPYSVTMGLLMAVLFSAAAAYLGLRIGQVFEAAIPIAIIAVGVGNMLGKKNMLGQNVIIQSIGASSGIIVAGAIFTLPALYILGLETAFYKVFLSSVLGGILGIVLLIPFRKYFVSDMHGKYPFPEATATTQVLVSGEKGGSQAKPLLMAGIIGGLYDFIVATFGWWNENFTTRVCGFGEMLAEKAKLVFKVNTGAAVLGLGYIVGLKYASIICAGSLAVWWIIIPGMSLIWGDSVLNQWNPEITATVGAMSPEEIFKYYAKSIGIGGIAGHAFLGLARGRSGYLHKASLQMNVSAVTAACMMMKKEVFEEVGGFEEELSVAFNDVDLCLRIGKAGYKIVYNPHVELYHYESKSRGAEDDEKKVRRFQSEIEFMRSRWIGLLKAGDPCYNPNLTLASWNYGLRADGRGVKPWTK